MCMNKRACLSIGVYVCVYMNVCIQYVYVVCKSVHVGLL